jgi:hypothetical protein
VVTQASTPRQDVIEPLNQDARTDECFALNDARAAPVTAVTEAFNTAGYSVTSYVRRRNDAQHALRNEKIAPRWEYPLDRNDLMNYATFP